MEKSKIVKNLTKAFTICFYCVLFIGVLFSTSLFANAVDEPTDGSSTSLITDLKGYTVTVPSGWTVSSEFGEFDFMGVINDVSLVSPSRTYKLGIGYGLSNNNIVPYSNRITVLDGYYPWQWNSSQALTIQFLGGADLTNSSLIQWLYDNNATFVNNEPEPEPEPVPVTSWADGETIHFFDTPIVQTTPPVVNDYQTIYHYSFWEKPYAILRDVVSSDGESYMPVVFYYDTYYEALYYGMSESQRNLIATDVYTNGYNEGYLKGKTEGQSSSIGSNLIGSGFTSITEALNRIIVYQSSTGSVVTLWVIISGAIGIALFIWILKLFAGG